MECPECKSTHINKNGRKRGKQNYICVNCQRQFLDSYQIQRGYSDEFKRECLTMYVNGMGFRAQGVCAQVASSDASKLRFVRKSERNRSCHSNELGQTSRSIVAQCLRS